MYKSAWNDTVKENWPLAHDLMLGMYFGYSLCCISNYVRLRRDRAPAEYMWTMYGPAYIKGPGYVRCHSCAQSKVNKILRRPEYLDLAKRFWPCDDPIEEEILI